MTEAKLAAKVALITGASRGIGKAIALAFAKEGADIALFYASRTDAAEEVVKTAKTFGVSAKAYKCNVGSFDEAKSSTLKVIEDFEHIDILVNNAGVTRDNLLIKMKEDDFDAVVDTSLKGAFNMTKQVYPLLLKQRSGRVINIASISGLNGIAGQANYSAAKAGVIGLTKAIAKELASRSVTVNAIAPGFIETDMTKDLSVSADDIPMKRLGTPEDVARLALFLASEDGGYITGEVIRVDGGLAI